MSEHAAPGWFDAALAQRPEDRDVRVKGCDVHYLRWGDVEQPGLVLVHGGAAHAIAHGGVWRRHWPAWR